MILFATAALYALTLAALALGQRKLLYFPSVAEVAPASVGLADAKILRVRTDDGETLLAWFVAPSAGKPLILYFHGNGEGLAARNVRFQWLTATGNGLLAIEYRGYAGSTGAPSERGLHQDAEAAYREALALGAAPDRLVAMGESLGSGVAVALASRRQVGAVVLDSPYSSLVDIAAARFWMFPVRLLMHDQFHSDRLIARVSAPILMVHGTGDEVVPIASGEKLFGLANEPKDFIRVEGAGHLALGSALPQTLEWIDRTFGRR
ncbi:MAG: alpha/beta hydrolase [Roseiarcus sp.]